MPSTKPKPPSHEKPKNHRRQPGCRALFCGLATPGGAIYGPKVMLIDQDAGSGGDFLPYAFKRLELGP